MNENIYLERTDSSHPDYIRLTKILDADLAVRDGDEHAFYAQFNKSDSIKNVVIAFENKEAIGCGAFKPFDESGVEIKRMFVDPGYRGKGIALEILNELEKWAGELNYSRAVLETGKKQPEAIRLYEKANYRLIKNYGQYENMENSVCMEKMI